MSEHTRTIHICTGTTCYVLGAAELLDELEQAIANGQVRATLHGTTCLGSCKNGQLGADSAKPPFVEIDGRVVAVSSLDQLRALTDGGD